MFLTCIFNYLPMPQPIRLNLVNISCLFTLLFFLGSCSSSGPSTDAESADYIQAYHPLIDKAELEIVEQDFADALQLYEKAFAAVPEPFAIDYYNAAISALLADEQKQVFDYLEKLALKGVSLEYLEAQDVFAELHETDEWKKFRKSYGKHRRKFKHRANLDLRADLDELYAKDQYFRQAEKSISVHADTIRKIEDNNVDFLLNVIEEHGYPGEALIGVADTLEQLPRFSIVIQRQTKAMDGYDFSSILKDAVQQGRIRPQAAAYLIEQQGRGSFNTKAFVTVNCSNPENCDGSAFDGKYFRDRLTSSQLDVLNENRSKLGLSSFPAYRKKVLYNMQDRRFKLGNYWSVRNYVVPSKEAASALTERLVVADVEAD